MRRLFLCVIRLFFFTSLFSTFIVGIYIPFKLEANALHVSAKLYKCKLHLHVSHYNMHKRIVSFFTTSVFYNAYCSFYFTLKLSSFSSAVFEMEYSMAF